MGRLRKEGERYACGKRKPNQSADAGDTVALRNRVIDLMSKARKLGTVQDMLWVHKKINSDQFGAAIWYDEQRHAYQKAVGSPGRARESVSGVLSGMTPEEAEKRVSGLVRRFDALLDLLSDDQKRALRVIEDQVFDFRELPTLVKALNVIHSYRMSGNRKRA